MLGGFCSWIFTSGGFNEDIVKGDVVGETLGIDFNIESWTIHVIS